MELNPPHDLLHRLAHVVRINLGATRDETRMTPFIEVAPRLIPRPAGYKSSVLEIATVARR